jgi:hypothetical protein
MGDSHFCKSDVNVMTEQGNFYQLDPDNLTEDSRLTPQMTDKWFEIRKEAMVTGSTCHKAVGLGKLKEQQEHFASPLLPRP